MAPPAIVPGVLSGVGPVEQGVVDSFVFLAVKPLSPELSVTGELGSTVNESIKHLLNVV